MQVQKFNDYLTEAKTPEKIRFLIVSDEPEDDKNFHTAKNLCKQAEKLGHKSYIYRNTGGWVDKNEEGDLYFHNTDDKKGFRVRAKDTIALVRGSVVRKDSWMDLVSRLEKHNVCVVNSREAINICADKYRTSLRLADYGVKQPKSVLINDPEKSMDAFEQLEEKFPIILKTLRGSKGVGVLFIESEIGLDSIVQVLYKQDEDADLLVQQYIKTDYDIRVLVLGGKIQAAMRRDVIPGDFRSNVSQGGKVKSFKLTENEIEECLKAAKAVNGVWTAVDFIPAKDRIKDYPYIIEVNSSPGTEGIEEASGQNISKEIIQYFEDKKNWVKVPSECGYKEVVTIKPFGQIVAKFDTGNSGMPVIHADKMKVHGSKVTWKLLDKTITSDILRTETISVGGLRDYDEERQVVKLDVEFAGGLYKDIEFTLDDREDKSPILFDREFMNRLNVMVNPQRKYVITTKYSLDDDKNKKGEK
jgi:ribosomal protein S6--L-glutamate ligase